MISDFMFNHIWSLFLIGIFLPLGQAIFEKIQPWLQLISLVLLFYRLWDNKDILLGSSNNEDIYQNGLAGERLALLKLTQLSDDYHVFTNLRISYLEKNSEIDLCVVGPGGVHIIEVKNFSGVLGGDWSDKHLLKLNRKHTHEKVVYNPVKQVGTHVFCLSGYLRQHGFREWVTSCVLFTDPDFRLEVTDKENKKPNIFNVSDSSILDFIQTGTLNQKTIPQTTVNKIVHVLENLSQEDNKLS